MLNQILSVRFNEQHKNNGRVFDFTGYHYWGGEDYFINKTDSVAVQKLLRFISDSKSAVINKKDIIYTTKSSEIPRFKLKEFIKEKGIKKTTKISYANVVILNRGIFNELVRKLKYGKHLFINDNMITDGNLKTWFSSSASSTIVNNNANIIKNCKNKNQILYVNTDNKQYMDSVLKKNLSAKNYFEDSIHVEEGTFISIYREAKLTDLLKLIMSNSNNIMNGKLKIVWDEELFVDLNKDGIELDDEYLQTLRDMLFSKDESNIKLGFEMMSNLVIDQPTLLTISFLLNELFHTTKFRPSYYSNSNTNLKALLKMLKTKGISWDRDWKTFGTGLRVNFKTGKEGEIVKKFLLDNINREFKLSNSASESLVDIVFSTEAR